MNYLRAIKEPEDIRKLHNKGKKLFLNQLESADSVDDLKRIIENHITVFFDEINFMFSLSARSLQLISDISKRNRKMTNSNQTDEFTDGKVRKTMQGIVDEIQKFRQEKLKQKQSKAT